MPHTFSDLGPAQQRLLIRAFNEGVPLDDPLAVGRIAGGQSRAEVMERRGLIHKRESKKRRTLWRCTDVGRGVMMEHRPVFLHRRSFPGITDKPWLAMRHEPETMGEAA